MLTTCYLRGYSWSEDQMNQLLEALLFCSTCNTLRAQNKQNTLFKSLVRLDRRLFIDMFDQEEKVQNKADMLKK